MVLRSLRDTMARQHAAMGRQAVRQQAQVPAYVPPPVSSAPQQRNVAQPVPMAQERVAYRQAAQPTVQSAIARYLAESARPYSQGPAVRPIQPVAYRQANPVVQPARTQFNQVAAQQALYDLDQVQYEIARAQEAARGQQTGMGYFPDDTGSTANLMALRKLEGQIISNEQQRQASSAPVDASQYNYQPALASINPQDVGDLPQYQKPPEEIRGPSQYYGNTGDTMTITERGTMRTRAEQAFPQMTKEEILGLNDSQLAALVDLAPAKPVVNADQYRYDPTGGKKEGGSLIPSWDDIIGVGNSEAVQQITGVAEAIAGGIRWAVDGAVGIAEDPSGAVSIVTSSPEALLDLIRGDTEGFFESEFGRSVVEGLEGLDWARTQNVAVAGEQAYQAATGAWKDEEQGNIADLGTVGQYLSASPDTVIWLVAIKADEELGSGQLDDVIINAYQNGYSSDRYLAQTAQAGIVNPPPQFTGGRAAWEAAIGYWTDDRPMAVKYGIRLLVDLALDPLTVLPLAGMAGKGVSTWGRAIAEAAESLAGRTAGRVIEGSGRLIEGAARAPDIPFEAAIKPAGYVARGVLGDLTKTATGDLRAQASSSIFAADDAISRAGGYYNTGNRDPIPVTVRDIPEDAPPAAATAPEPTPEATVRPAAPQAPTAQQTPAQVWMEQVLNGNRQPGQAASDVTATAQDEARETFTKVAEFWGVKTGDTPTSTRSVAADEVTPASGEAAPALRGTSESATPYIDAATKRPTEGFGERVARWIDGSQPSEHPFSAAVGRSDTPIDEVITRAVATGDAGTIARADQVLEILDTVVNPNLQGDPFYRPMRSSDPGALPIRLQGDDIADEMLIRVARPGDNIVLGSMTNAQRSTLVRRLNSEARIPFERLAEYEQYVNSVLPLLRHKLGVKPGVADGRVVSSLLPAPRRIHSSASPTSFRSESVEWLAHEFIVTTDPQRARAIFEVLKNNGQTVLGIDPSGRPFAKAFASNGRPDALRRLRALRSAYQDFINEPDDSFLSRSGMLADAIFRPPVHIVHPATAAVTGFGGSLKRAGKDAATWFQSLQPKAGVPDFSHITDWRVRWLGDQGRLGLDDAELLDTVIDWRPPASAGDMYGGTLPRDYTWRVAEALEWAHWYKNEDVARRQFMTPEELARTPEFDLNATIRTIGERAAGLPLNPTKAERLAATRAIKGMDGLLRFFRDTRLYGPVSGVAGLINDVLGTAMQQVVSGHADNAIMNIFQPWNWAQFTRAYRSMDRDPQRFLQAYDSKIHVQTGELFPADLAPITTRGEVPYSGKPWLNEKWSGAPLVKHLANIGSVPAIKDLRIVGSDLMPRATLYENVFEKTITRDGLDRFKALLRDTYGDTWQAEYRKITAQANHDFGKGWGGEGYMTPKQVIDATGNTNLGKAWQAEINRAQKISRSEVDRVLFSGKSTNLDELMRRTVLFHYWQTRASMFYLRQSLRNPVLLNMQFKMLSELQQIAEDENMPAWAGSMLRFLRYGNGIGAAFNPWSYLFPVFVLDVSDIQGNKFAAFTHMLNPILQGVMAATGLTSTTPGFNPMRPTEKFLQNLLNWGKAEGVDFEGMPVIGKYFNNDVLDFTYASDELINDMTGWVNEKLPFKVDDFNPFDRDSYQQDLQVTAVQQVMTDIYGPDRDQWPDDVYDTAITFVTTGQGESDVGEQANGILGDISKTQVVGAVLAGGAITTNDWRDAAIQAQQDAFADGEITSDEQDALDNRADATLADTQWGRTNAAYHNIGGPLERQLSETYNSIIYSPEDIEGYIVIPPASPGGQWGYMSGDELAQMTKEERIEWANWWLSTRGEDAQRLQDYRTAQDQFLVDHPEYASFDLYKSGAYDQGLTQFRTGLAETNPNFARAMEAASQQYQKDGLTGTDLVTKLDQWAISQAGFFAATGQQYKADDPDPISTYDPDADYTQNPNLGFMQAAAPEPKSNEPYVIPGTRGPDGVYVDLSGRTREEAAADANQITEEKRRAILYSMLEKYPSMAPTIQPLIAQFEQADLVKYLTEDVQQYNQANQQLESMYGKYWDETEGAWAASANTKEERAALGLPEWIKYPEKPDLLQAYFSWVGQGNPPDYVAFIQWYWSVYGG